MLFNSVSKHSHKQCFFVYIKIVCYLFAPNSKKGLKKYKYHEI